MKEQQWPTGVKRTRQREAVLSVLENAELPMSALEIYDRLDKSEPVWLSTVYRALEIFTDKNVVTKIMIDGDTTFYTLTRRGHMHYAVCVECRKIVTMKNCPMTDFEPALSDDDFHVLGHRVEMYGYCKDCDKRIKNNQEVT